METKQSKQKVKFSIRLQLLIPVILCTFLMGTLIGQITISIAKERILEVATDQAKTMALVAAQKVDVNTHNALQPGDEDNTQYRLIVNELQEIKGSSNIKFLYTLKLINGELCYVVDTDTSEDRCAIGDPLEVDGVKETVIDNGEVWLSDGIIVDEWGTVIQAYVPITDAGGKVVAVLGSDYDAESIQQTLSQLQTVATLVSIVSMVVAVVIIYMVINSLMKKINLVGNKIYDIVNSDGDLTQELPSNNKDELGVIAGYVNDLLHYIRVVVANINESSKVLNSSVRASLQNVQETSGGINQVFNEMEQMSASMEETNASITQIGEIINSMLANVDAMASAANEGKHLTDDISHRAQSIKNHATNTQNEVRTQALEMERALQDRIERSQSVTEIANLTEQILNIASETNLLALNASIEAARAGDAGRGFGVVATEITKLAEGSAQTAEEIRRISDEVISAVNGLADKAKEMLEFLNTKTINGYEELVGVGEDYYDNSGKINAMMVDFNSKFVEFEERMKEVNDSIDAVSIAVDESTRAIVEVTQTSEQLAGHTDAIENDANKNMDIANQLENEANKFKI